MKRQVLKRIFCVFSLLIILSCIQMPAYAVNYSQHIRASTLNLSPNAGDTITVTVSVDGVGAWDDSDTQLLIGLSCSEPDVLLYKDVKTSIVSGNIIKDHTSSNVWIVYVNNGLSGVLGGDVLEITFQVNPNLAVGKTIALTPYYATGNINQPVFKDGKLNVDLNYGPQISISCIATSTGEGQLVFLNENGGLLTIDTLKTGAGGTLSYLPTPTRDGYTFDGWYTAMSGGEKVNTETVFSDSTTIYAHWTLESGQPENGGSSGTTIGDAVTWGVAGSVVGVLIYLLILLLI